jgi:hypothetical protein
MSAEERTMTIITGSKGGADTFAYYLTEAERPSKARRRRKVLLNSAAPARFPQRSNRMGGAGKSFVMSLPDGVTREQMVHAVEICRDTIIRRPSRPSIATVVHVHQKDVGPHRHISPR